MGLETRLGWFVVVTTLASCGLVGWLAEPVGGEQEQAAPRPCVCAPSEHQGAVVSTGGLPQAAPNVLPPGATPTRGALIIDDVTTIGSVLLPNPLLWGLAGQALHLLFGTAGMARRRKPNVS